MKRLIWIVKAELNLFKTCWPEIVLATLVGASLTGLLRTLAS